jgi:hypothetical protein
MRKFPFWYSAFAVFSVEFISEIHRHTIKSSLPKQFKEK